MGGPPLIPVWGCVGGCLRVCPPPFLGLFPLTWAALAAHGGAALALAWALLEGWDSGCFWLLFGLCRWVGGFFFLGGGSPSPLHPTDTPVVSPAPRSVPPAVTEVLLMVSMLGCRRRAI